MKYRPETMSELRELESEHKLIKHQYQYAAVAAVSVLLVGAVFYHTVEHFSWLNAFYFCTITLTTIGYGDIVPTTAAGKLFTMGYVLVGIGIIAAFANIFIKNTVVRRQLRQAHKRDYDK